MREPDTIAVRLDEMKGLAVGRRPSCAEPEHRSNRRSSVPASPCSLPYRLLEWRPIFSRQPSLSSILCLVIYAVEEERLENQGKREGRQAGDPAESCRSEEHTSELQS